MMTVSRSMIILFLAFLIGGCSTTKKGGTSDDSSDLNDQPFTPGELKLSGDSDSGSAGGLQTVYFDFNSAALTDSAKTVLNANAEYLKSNASVNVQVEGHCDERGGVQYNLALSEKRAKSIRDYIKALGINSKRITVIGYGKERPIDLGHAEDAWAKNRRGNFVVTSL